MTPTRGARKTPSAWSVWVALLVPAVLIIVTAAGSVVGNRSRENVLHPQGPPPAIAFISDTFRQGWGFFTRDAREERSDLFYVVDGDWQRVTAGVAASPENLFGLNRSQRAYMADIAFIT